MKIYPNILSLIGQTPIVKLNHFDTGPCELFIKLEGQNPSGSVKDRIALNMINTAERKGHLRPGGTIIEATAGNTGLGLAMIAAIKGYKLIIVLPDKMSKEKIYHLQAYGAEIVMTRSDVSKGHPEYYQDLAQRIADETENCFYVNQFGNLANPEAHEQTTGPEIWAQMEHDLDAFVVGVGTGGTISGVSRYLSKVAPHVEYILADPVGSIVADYVNCGSITQKSATWLVEGIGEDYIPVTCDLSLATKAYSVSDKESFLAVRELLRKEGIFAGSCTGTVLHAALQYCREQTKPKRVLLFSGDSGNKYLTKVYNDYWMIEQGFISKPEYGDLRDVIGRLYSERAVVSVGPHDALATVLKRMKMHDVSQIPVIEEDKLLGIIDESNLLMAVVKDEQAFQQAAKDVMTTDLIAISAKADIDELEQLLSHYHVVVVMYEQQFLGLITRIDLINYLRRKVLASQ